MRYTIVVGKLDIITQEVDKYLKNGWELVGGLTTATKGSVVEYSQAMVREEQQAKPQATTSKAPSKRTAKKVSLD